MSTRSRRCTPGGAALAGALVMALVGTPASAGMRREPAAAPPATTTETVEPADTTDPKTAEEQANLASWESDEPAEPAAAPAEPAAAPVPTVAPPPDPAIAPAPVVVQPDPVLQRRRKAASGVAAAGGTLLGLGGVAWLFLALPAYIAAEVAQQRAEDDPLLVSENELYDRAERRRRFARISFWSGLGGVVVGGTMLGVGLGTKTKVEREMARPRARLHLVPTVGRTHAGASLMLRY